MNLSRKEAKLKGRSSRAFSHKKRMQYYDSDEWKARREIHLQRVNYKSELSGEPAQVVHHCKYPVWLMKPYFDRNEKGIIFPDPSSGLGKERHWWLLAVTKSEHEQIHNEFKHIWNSKKLLLEAFNVS